MKFYEMLKEMTHRESPEDGRSCLDYMLHHPEALGDIDELGSAFVAGLDAALLAVSLYGIPGDLGEALAPLRQEEGG